MLKINELKKITIFSLIFIGIFCYLVQFIGESFYFDSGTYWNLKEMFVINGIFKFENFNYPLRGYAFPFLLFIFSYILKSIGVDQVYSFYLLSSFLFAFLSVYIFPRIMLMFNKSVSNTHILFFSLTIFYFWRGMFRYPLSDFYAYCIFTTGYILIMDFDKQNSKNYFSEYSDLIGYIFMFFSTLIRPQYIIGLLIFIIVKFLKSNQNYHSVIRIISKISIAFIICYSPQIIINHNNYNKISPFIQTQIAYGTQQGLMLSQLKWGIKYQKFEGNIGLGIPTVFYLDKNNSFLAEKIDENYVLLDYVLLVLRYPLNFFSMYLKHFFNAMNITWPTVYINDISSVSFLFSLLNFCFWYRFLIIIFESVKHRISLVFSKALFTKDGSFIETFFSKSSIFVLISLIVSLVGVIGAVETRFILPLFILNYSSVISRFDESIEFTSLNKKTIILNTLLFIFVMCLFFTLSISTFTSIVDHEVPTYKFELIY